MKIPKYIQELVDRRCRLATDLLKVSYELDCWLDKNYIECEDCDTHTGVEIYMNPYDSRNRIIQAIIDKE